MSLLPLFVSEPAKQPWIWAAAVIAVVVLLLLNLVLIVAVYIRRLRQGVRARRAQGFRSRFEPVVNAVVSGKALPERELLRRELRDLDELERPIAASMLIERLRKASPEERGRILELTRETGAVRLMLRSTTRRRPWRRALAIKTLGWLGAKEAVPLLLERLFDRNRYVREAGVRALGRIGDPQALPALSKLYLEPGRVAAGSVYEALVAFGSGSAQIFAEGLRSPNERVRVSSCFGIFSALPPDGARRLLEPMLEDPSAPVRAAGAEVLGRISGAQVPDVLAQASHDEQRSVRRAAISTLGSYDDPRALRLLLDALEDPDRDAALRAGESLVRLRRLPGVGAAASDAIERTDAWPLETALILESLGAM